MNTTTAEKIVIMQAAEDGQAIEYKLREQRRANHWTPFRTGSDAHWNWLGCDYRIATKKPRELWINRTHDDRLSIYASEHMASEAVKGFEDKLANVAVHFREVTENDKDAIQYLEDLVIYIKTTTSLFATPNAAPELMKARALLTEMGRL